MFCATPEGISANALEQLSKEGDSSKSIHEALRDQYMDMMQEGGTETAGPVSQRLAAHYGAHVNKAGIDQVDMQLPAAPKHTPLTKER